MRARQTEAYFITTNPPSTFRPTERNPVQMTPICAKVSPTTCTLQNVRSEPLPGRSTLLRNTRAAASMPIRHECDFVQPRPLNQYWEMAGLSQSLPL